MEDTEQPKQTNQSHKPWRQWLDAVIIVILVLGMALLAWLYIESSQQRADLQNRVSQLEQKLSAKQHRIAELTGQPSESAVQANSAPNQLACNTPDSTAIKTTIKQAVSSQNYSALKPLMASQVNVVYAASEKGGYVSPNQAVADMDFLAATANGPWDFDLPQSTLDRYQSNRSYGAYFADSAYVGKAANGALVSFMFDNCRRINQVFIGGEGLM